MAIRNQLGKEMNETQTILHRLDKEETKIKRRQFQYPKTETKIIEFILFILLYSYLLNLTDYFV